MDWVQVAALAVSTIAAISAIASVVIAYKVYRRNTNPRVVAYIDKADTLLLLVIANIGSSPALDVQIDIDGKVTYADPFEAEFGRSFVSRGVPVLMPGSARSTVIGPAGAFPKVPKRMPVAKVSYKNSHRSLAIRFEDEYELDWTSFALALHAQDAQADMARALTAAAKKYLKEG